MNKRSEDRPKTPKETDDELDDALENTFPASDPPAMTEPKSRVGHAKRKEPPHPSKP